MKIEKLEEYKPMLVAPNTYESRELKLKEIVDKVNEIVEALSSLTSK
mgnify:CR=1 FL=1